MTLSLYRRLLEFPILCWMGHTIGGCGVGMLGRSRVLDWNGRFLGRGFVIRVWFGFRSMCCMLKLIVLCLVRRC